MTNKVLRLVAAIAATLATACPLGLGDKPLLPSTIVFADGESVTRMLGSGDYINTAGGDGDGALSWASDSAATATVDASSGVVTLVSAGEATITATRAATSAYESVSASYALTVTALSPSTIAFADGATVNRLLGSGPYVNAVSGEGSGSLSYRSSVPAVAAVDAASGQVDVVGLGTTTISVDKAATATHASASASYTLIVTALPLSTIVFADGGSVSRTLGTGPYTNAVSGEGDGAISFESSSPAVASVDAATGEVTMVSQGTAVITASKAATATHEAASASYTLTVLSPSTIVFVTRCRKPCET